MQALEASGRVGAGARPPPAYGTRRQLLGWASYDWAVAPFFSVIITFVFAAYVTKGVAADEVTGTAEWGWAMTVSALIIGFTSPILGAIADAGGRRKPWLFGLTLITVLATAALWIVEPEPSYLRTALLLVILANTCLEVGQAFYNAMLPDLARPEEIGRWSGWGWGIGYVAGICALVTLLLLFIQADPPLLGLDKASAENVRIAGPFIALWIALFSIPLFLIVPDRPSERLPVATAVRQGLAALAQTFRNVRAEKNIALFLIARLIYNDGLNTLFAFGGIYAAGTFQMDTSEIIWFGLALNVTAGLGAFGLAFMDDRLGSKPTILVSLVGLLVFGTAALIATDKSIFWAIGVCIGLFVGPAQSASRTLMARLAPEDQRTEMFGLYALTGKVTAFMGPFLFGTATLLFATQRAGMATLLVLFIIGGVLLLWVKEPKRG
jgi:UMF1 family MFS transporter